MIFPTFSQRRNLSGGRRQLHSAPHWPAVHHARQPPVSPWQLVLQFFPVRQLIHRFEKPVGHHVFHTDLRNLNAVSFVARADFPMDSSVTPPNQTLTTRKIYRPEKHLIGDWSFQMFFKGSIIISSISSSTFTHFNSFHPVSSNFPLDHSWFHQTSSAVPPAMCFHSHATFHRGAFAGCGCDRCDRDRSGVLLERWQLAGVLHRATAVLEQCSQTAASWHFCIEMTKISGVMYYKVKKKTNSDYPKLTLVDFIAFYSWVL